MKYFRIILALVLIAGMFTIADSSRASNITISNIQATVNAMTCEMTVTWTTNVEASSVVYYGTSCASLPGTATGTNCVTNHSVTFDVSSFGDNYVYFKVESGTNCETELSSCQSKRRGLCMSDD